MEARDVEKVMSMREEQPRNVPSPMNVTAFGSAIAAREEQPSNASSPIKVMDA